MVGLSERRREHEYESHRSIRASTRRGSHGAPDWRRSRPTLNFRGLRFSGTDWGVIKIARLGLSFRMILSPDFVRRCTVSTRKRWQHLVAASPCYRTPTGRARCSTPRRSGAASASVAVVDPWGLELSGVILDAGLLQTAAPTGSSKVNYALEETSAGRSGRALIQS